MDILDESLELRPTDFYFIPVLPVIQPNNLCCDFGPPYAKLYILDDEIIVVWLRRCVGCGFDLLADC